MYGSDIGPIVIAHIYCPNFTWILAVLMGPGKRDVASPANGIWKVIAASLSKRGLNIFF
jgi:hypothetical protein